MIQPGLAGLHAHTDSGHARRAAGFSNCFPDGSPYRSLRGGMRHTHSKRGVEKRKAGPAAQPVEAPKYTQFKASITACVGARFGINNTTSRA